MQLGIIPGSYTITYGFDWLHDLVVPVQFAYRLSNSFTVISLLVIFSILLIVGKSDRRYAITNAQNQIIVLLSILACGSVMTKLITTYVEFRAYPQFVQDLNMNPSKRTVYGDQAINMVIFGRDYTKETKDTNKYPGTFSAYMDYSMPKAFINTPKTEEMPIVAISIKNWDQLVAVRCETKCQIATNVIPSVFAGVVVDGKPDFSETVSAAGTVMLNLGAGDHTVKFHHLGRAAHFTMISISLTIAWFVLSGIAALAQLGTIAARKLRTAA